MKLKLYHYWRSSSSWRVRWAFAHKNIPCEYIAISLLNGEAESPEHLKRNPLGFVPVLEMINGNDSKFLSESMAIIQWADETHPQPSLLPGDAYQRARVRQLSEIITADTQPLQNLNPMQLHSDDTEKQREWARHWIHRGLSAYETLVKSTAGKFSFGDTLTIADLALIPQCYNAKRFEVVLDAFPTVAKIYENALATPSCQASAPDRFAPPEAQ